MVVKNRPATRHMKNLRLRLTGGVKTIDMDQRDQAGAEKHTGSRVRL